MNTEETFLLDGWRFQKGPIDGCPQSSTFDDATWESVRIPHDWAISEPFDKNVDMQVTAIIENGETVASEKTGRTGSLPWIGEGWYRRTITIPQGCRHAELVFDGAMARSTLYFDGKKINYRISGYVTFSVDITPYLDDTSTDSNHTIAVHLSTEPQSSRWYPGAGLYRPVRLITSGKAWIDRTATFVRTTSLHGNSATVAISTQLHGEDSALYSATLYNEKGQSVAASEPTPNNDFTIVVKNPELWSPESPALYTVCIEAKKSDGTLLDAYELKTGIRIVEISEKGFFLNGKLRKFKGACLHHDLGPVGAAFNKDAFRRQLRILRECGCDSIRTSHNMPAPWQMDICDEEGFMVMAESFDVWYNAKCANDYAKYFADNWLQDLDGLILFNRNHPSIVFWSIGNESHDLDTPEGLEVYPKMEARCKELDPTRPVTQGIHVPDVAIDSGILQMTDIAGVNYKIPRLERVHSVSNMGIALGTENASTVSSRGIYKFPVNASPFNAYPDGQCSSYDLEWGGWGNPPDDDFAACDDYPWMIGQFVWTGFDYFGEPSPYDGYWPSRSSYFGLVDLAGIPKDRYFLYRSQWRKDTPTLHVLPHWTWPGREGQITPVFCYTSYPSAELFINGRSYGRKTFDPSSRFDRYRLRWEDAIYEPGELRVVAYDNDGNKAAEKIIQTAGEPTRIVAQADTTTLQPPTEDDTPSLSFITLSIVDSNGNLCPNANIELSFKTTGSIKYKAACNGDATSLEQLSLPHIKTFNGKLVAVVEAITTGTGIFSASANGLPPVEINFNS